MKIKHLLLIYGILLFTLHCQKAPQNKRKINLAEQTTTAERDAQLTTTIHLEPTLRRAVSVMFFENQTGDQNLDWLRKGLTEMFIRALSQSPNLSVLTSDRLLEILERLDNTPSTGEIDMDMAAIMGKEANSEIILTGNISRRGDSLRIHVKVHETDQGQILREESVEGSGLENLFSMVDQLTQKIMDDLQPDESDEDWNQSIAELTTNSLEAWESYTTGDDFMNKYMVEEAIPHFEKAIELDPTFISAYLDLYPIYAGRGQDNLAYPLLQELMTLRVKATPQERYQIDLFNAGVNNDASLFMKTLHDWLDEYPKDRDANYTLADLYAKWNNYDQAIVYFKNAIQSDPNYRIAYNRLGYAYANIGKFEKALSFLNKYKNLAIDEANPYDSMGEIYFLYGDYQKAEKKLKKALDINDNFNSSRWQLANLYLEMGNYKKAIQTYHEFLDRVSNETTKANAYSMLARAYWRTGERDSAIAYYEMSLEKNPLDFMAIERLNDIHLKNNEVTKAQEGLQKTYNQFKALLKSDLYKFRALYALITFSTFWDVNQDETMNILENIIKATPDAIFRVEDEINLTNLKFGLTLLYIQTQQGNETDRLWPEAEIIPKELWTILRDVRNQGYTDNWKGFALLNRAYYKDVDEGITFYEPLIEYAMEYDTQAWEMMFRLLLADLYFHTGDDEDGKRQLAFVGMPQEETWMVIGPFDNRDGFRKKYPPEKKIRVKQTYSEKSWKVKWQPARDGIYDGFINLSQIYERYNWSVGYGLIYVFSSTKKKVQFRFGTDDGSIVWLNDEVIWKLNQGGPALFDDDKVNVVLQKGFNKILIKVCNSLSDWGFFFRITDIEGNGIQDIRYISPDALEEKS